MTRFQHILSREGEDITWHKRQEGVVDPDTGDLTITWTTETIIAIIQHVRADEIPFEAGYSLEDYICIFVTADIKHLDKITYRGADYEILPPQAFYFRGQLEYRSALCRRLIV